MPSFLRCPDGGAAGGPGHLFSTSPSWKTPFPARMELKTQEMVETGLSRSLKGIHFGLRGALPEQRHCHSRVQNKIQNQTVRLSASSHLLCRYPLTSSGSCCPTVSCCATVSRPQWLRFAGRASGLAAASRPLCALQWVKPSRNWP